MRYPKIFHLQKDIEARNYLHCIGEEAEAQCSGKLPNVQAHRSQTLPVPLASI